MRVLITGASRGIGAATAVCFAKTFGKSAQIGLFGRSLAEPVHAHLEGSLLDTSRRVEKCGATAIPMQVDVSNATELKLGLTTILSSMGGLDVLVNNASALWLQKTNANKMDMLHAVNQRATMICIDECHDALSESHGSIVTLSPPIRLGRLDWIRRHPAYTISKYSMTLATLGAATDRVRANCLWPAKTVSTAATRYLEDEGILKGAYSQGRSPDDVGAAIVKLATDSTWNARTVLDEDVIDLAHSTAPVDAFVEDGCTVPRV